VEIVPKVHSIDGLDHPIPSVGMVPYLIEESPKDYTLIDTCFTCNIPTFESYLSKAGIDIFDINRIVLTHLHPDHVEAEGDVDSSLFLSFKEVFFLMSLNISIHM
jgi:glyoxylase-like metal-dependent hydrolase (beta-lactamase superfamily II)